MKMAAPLAVASMLLMLQLLLQLRHVMSYNMTGEGDYYDYDDAYYYYDDYYYDYGYDDEGIIDSHTDVVTVVVDEDGSPIIEIVETAAGTTSAALFVSKANASVAAAAKVINSYKDEGESDGYEEDPEVEMKPKRKFGYEKSLVDSSRVLEEKLMSGSMRHSVMNDTISVVACLPKHDIRGSRASGTEEMVLLKDLREREREEERAFTGRGKPTLKELQEMRLKKRQQESVVKERMVRKFQLGLDCEMLVCGSCRLIAEEMASMVHRSLTDTEYPTVDSAIGKVCRSREMQRYSDIVPFLCEEYIMSLPGYREALVEAFDGMTIDELSRLDDVSSKRDIAEKICVTKFSACSPESYSFSTEKTFRYQERWSDRCFLCQAAADSIEERVLLLKRATDEGHLRAIVASTCARLRMGDECREMLSGPRVDDFAWIARLHYENVAKKLKSEKRFSDKACEEAKYCDAWMPDDEDKDRQALEAMDEVFA